MRPLEFLEPKYYVTLVHGTFAPDATWTHEESVLRKTLTERLDGSVVFSSFEWGGANTQAARQRGAQVLAAVLAERMEKFPTANHFIVAHSHGGNVAMMACCSAQIVAKLRGLICLATPFLSFQPRRYLLNLRLLAISAVTCVIFGLMLAISGVLPEPAIPEKVPATDLAADSVSPNLARTELQSSSPTALLLQTYVGVTRQHGSKEAMILLVLCGTASFWMSARLAKKATRAISLLQERSAVLYRTPEDVPFQLLGVSLPFDEARLWLRAVWRLAEVPFLLNPLFIWLYGLGGLVLIFRDLPARLAELNLEHTPVAWLWCGLWGAFLIFMMAALMAAATQAVMFLSVFIRGNPLGYGWDGFAASWVGRITAREEPPLPASRYETLKVKAAVITAEIGQARTWSKLRHSLVYESPAVIQGIAEWMKRQLEPRSEQGNAGH